MACFSCYVVPAMLDLSSGCGYCKALLPQPIGILFALLAISARRLPRGVASVKRRDELMGTIAIRGR